MKSKKTIIIISIAILVILGIFLSLSWYRFTPFYQSCTQVKVEMTEFQVEQIMQPYLSDSRFSASKNGALWGSGFYISSNASGNQCNISIKDGQVDKVEARFE